MVIPTDSATAAQRGKYATYVAARTPRTATPQGPARMLFALDLVGSADQIAEALYVQILTDIATKLGPALGRRPAPGPG